MSTQSERATAIATELAGLRSQLEREVLGESQSAPDGTIPANRWEKMRTAHTMLFDLIVSIGGKGSCR